MTPHTQGPWKKDGMTIYSESGRQICNAASITYSSEREEDLSNALLIAASPEMEAALEQFVWAFEQGEEHGGSVKWEDIEDAYGMACVALRKVKGGAP